MPANSVLSQRGLAEKANVDFSHPQFGDPVRNLEEDVDDLPGIGDPNAHERSKRSGAKQLRETL
jgi:hypothetical protein